MNNRTAFAWVLCAAATFGCRAESEGFTGQQPPAQSGTGGALASASVSARENQASSAPTCVAASDLPAPPRKVHDKKPDLSDLDGVQTHGGVLVFAVTIGPSGSVGDVRLVKDTDTRHPWPTLVDRWRSAISDWRYEPATVHEKPVAVCLTVTVNIHVMSP
jgi:outer membrane biosynthesis protein TonB